jgi:HTH-type transcriptional regulator / antitoxin HigA
MATNFSELRPHILVGPGDYIEEQLEVRGWTQQDFADIIGVSIQTVNKLLKNKTNITTHIATALAEAFEQSAQYWLNLDALYQIQSSNFSNQKQEVQTRKEIYNRIPVNEMARRGWINKGKSFEEFKANILKFFGWDSLDFSLFDKTLGPSFRKSEKLAEKFSPSAAMCWFQMAKNTACTINAPAYNQDELKKLYKKIAYYSSLENGVADFLTALNACGVKFFVLGHLKNTYIDGAAFMDKHNPVIVYTGRYKRLDNFWFTVAHEIAHVIYHLNSAATWFIDIENNVINQQEIEANTYAQEMLKHHEIKAFFAQTTTNNITSQQIISCAESLSIHPSLVVGALFYIKKIYPTRLHEFSENILAQIPDVYQVDKYLMNN